MKVIAAQRIQKNIAAIISVLKSGGLILFPTETCYGVGVDATNADAVSKLLRYKNRPAGKAISVAVADKDYASKLIESNIQSENIINKFLPGPITVVGKSLGMVDRRLESELGTLGIRIPAYPLLLDLLKVFARPLTSTSANLAGDPTPYNVQKLLSALPEDKLDMIDLVIDAGELEHNPPSLVIDTTGTSQVYRPGLITPEDLEKGEVFLSQSAAETKKIAADFIIKQFSPHSPTLLVLLEGELGAGKTQFAAGLGMGLGITQTISSPSYNLAHEYPFTFAENSGKFHHLDLWRTQTNLDLREFEIDLTEQMQLVAVEWPEKLSSIPVQRYYTVKIFKLDERQRRIIITPHDKKL